MTSEQHDTPEMCQFCGALTTNGCAVGVYVACDDHWDNPDAALALIREQLARVTSERDAAVVALKAADALSDWVGWWLSARREEEASKFTEMRKRLDAYRAARTAGKD